MSEGNIAAAGEFVEIRDVDAGEGVPAEGNDDCCCNTGDGTCSIAETGAPTPFTPEQLAARRDAVELTMRSLFGTLLPAPPDSREVADWSVAFFGAFRAGDQADEFRLEFLLLHQPRSAVIAWAEATIENQVFYIDPTNRLAFIGGEAAKPFGHVVAELHGYEVESLDHVD